MSVYQLEKSCVMEHKFDFSYQLTQKNTNIMAKHLNTLASFYRKF